MDYGRVIGDSIEYVREGLWGRWTRWILLIISSVIFPLILGYTMELYRGVRPAPEPTHWWKLFVDGIKLIVAWIIYMLPVIAVLLVFGGYAVLTALQTAAGTGTPDYFATHPEQFIPIISGFLIGLVIALVLAFIIAIIATIGVIRMARMNKFSEAFNFNGIFETIGRMGWGNYLVALIIFWVITFIFSLIMNLFFMIPYIGWLIWLVLIPALTIFEARYITLIYESAGEAPGVSTG